MGKSAEPSPSLRAGAQTRLARDRPSNLDPRAHEGASAVEQWDSGVHEGDGRGESRRVLRVDAGWALGRARTGASADDHGTTDSTTSVTNRCLPAHLADPPTPVPQL